MAHQERAKPKAKELRCPSLSPGCITPDLTTACRCCLTPSTSCPTSCRWAVWSKAPSILHCRGHSYPLSWGRKLKLRKLKGCPRGHAAGKGSDRTAPRYSALATPTRQLWTREALCPLGSQGLPGTLEVASPEGRWPCSRARLSQKPLSCVSA